MKHLVLILAIAGMALSSCTGKYTIAKRKYNKGFYVSKSGDTKKPESKFTKANTLNAKSSVNELAMNKPEELKPNTIENTTPISVANVSQPVNELKATNQKQVSNITASVEKNNVTTSKVIKPLEIRKPLILPMKKGGSDANLIVLIILCFLWWLNLIAVYIHDGKSITLNFWITLLLDLTFIGGVIFSLLVVLDVVNLA